MRQAGLPSIAHHPSVTTLRPAPAWVAPRGGRLLPQPGGRLPRQPARSLTVRAAQKDEELPFETYTPTANAAYWTQVWAAYRRRRRLASVPGYPSAVPYRLLPLTIL